MKKTKKIVMLIVLLINVLTFTTNVQANIGGNVQKLEFTDEFKEYMDLEEDEKAKVMMPRMYEIPYKSVEYYNPFKIALTAASEGDGDFDLKDIIPENVIVKNQGSTGRCWTFATNSALETNLALKNYYKGITAKTYDFSEMHMDYAMSKTFKNSYINENAFNRTVGVDVGGSWYISSAYLTNGVGAINESEMPFDVYESLIDIEEIQGKTVTSQVYDTIEFASSTPTTVTTEMINQMKNHIKNHGSIYASIHGVSGVFHDCYNNDTGAIFCDGTGENNCQTDHAVSIVGWIDDYGIENFNAQQRPTNKGAWIIKNSWGEKDEWDLTELKEKIFEINEEYFLSIGINSAEDVTAEYIEYYGYSIEGDKAVMNVGKDGFMYISYEDINIYSNLSGIVKASDYTDYENIYQYNYLGYSSGFSIESSKNYIGNIFTKKTSGTEYLTHVGINILEGCTCKVYVNPNGTSLAQADLQLVTLETGTTEILDGAGYHTLEFANPVEIEGNSFAVVIEIQDSSWILIEQKLDEAKNPHFSEVEVETEKCFWTWDEFFESNEWKDLGKLSNQMGSDWSNGDSTIKAFTTSQVDDDTLKEIKITTPPTKTSYFVGENFDKTGMVVTTYYNNGKSNTIFGYNITGGTNMQEGQASVTITYEDKTVEQPVSIVQNSVVSIQVTTPPTNTVYTAGEDFDKTGMVVEATYKDETTKEITEYEITDGIVLKNGQTSITIKYEEQTTTQAITVEPNPVIELEIQNEPDKTDYIVGQDFDKTGMIVIARYENGLEREIADYTIENGKNLTAGQTEVIIKFEDRTVTQGITVANITVSSIQIKDLPSKITYIQNKENLDLTGGSILVKYNNGVEDTVSMEHEDVTVTGFDNSTLGKVVITVTYEEKTTTYEVTIIEEITAQNSNLDNAKCDVLKVQCYTFTDPSKEEYIIMNLKVKDIVRNLENDSMEYYYYLSGKQNETNIQNWVKISESQTESGNITFKVNTKDIANYDELKNENVLFLYIKEVAIKGGDQKVVISKPMKVESTVEIEQYLDNQKINYDNDDTPINTPNNPSNETDNTVSGEKIPNAGKTVLLIVFISGFVVILILSMKKIKDFKDIK